MRAAREEEHVLRTDQPSIGTSSSGTADATSARGWRRPVRLRRSRPVPRPLARSAIVVALLVSATACGGGGGASSEESGASLADSLMSELRDKASAAGVTIPDDIAPSDDQLATLDDGTVSRAELERQAQTHLSCLETAGFEVSPVQWDDENDVVDFSVGTGSVDEPGFEVSPFLSPTFLRCYATHYALTSTQWSYQSMPDPETLRTEARALLECVAEAGHDLHTLDELLVVLEQHQTDASEGADVPTKEAVDACMAQHPLRTRTPQELQDLGRERLR